MTDNQKSICNESGVQYAGMFSIDIGPVRIYRDDRGWNQVFWTTMDGREPEQHETIDAAMDQAEEWGAEVSGAAISRDAMTGRERDMLETLYRVRNFLHCSGGALAKSQCMRNVLACIARTTGGAA